MNANGTPRSKKFAFIRVYSRPNDFYSCPFVAKSVQPPAIMLRRRSHASFDRRIPVAPLFRSDSRSRSRSTDGSPGDPPIVRPGRTSHPHYHVLRTDPAPGQGQRGAVAKLPARKGHAAISRRTHGLGSKGPMAG